MFKEESSAVLVVDDDPMQIEIVTSMIICLRENTKIDSVLSSSQALKLVQKRLADVLLGTATMYKVILLDYSIDEMDGP